MNDSRTGCTLSLPEPHVGRLAEDALVEDLGAGDVTSDLTIPPGRPATGRVVAREAGVLSGLPVARAVFRAADPGLGFVAEREDGTRIERGDTLCTISGDARAILRAERTALNFLQRMSGIATLTARFVEAVEGTGARIVDTRKTTPGLRLLEKYAVRCGGGRNHRFGLSDGFLLKDNHRLLLGGRGASLEAALANARGRLPHTVPIEVELDDRELLAQVLDSGVDAVLLDNFTADELRAAVQEVAGRALVEASGGISLDTVRSVAETGVDLISVGALTHSAPALDLALDLVVERDAGSDEEFAGVADPEAPGGPRAGAQSAG